MATTEPPLEPTEPTEPTEPPATRQCPVTGEVRIALWFPAGSATRLAADLEKAESVVSVTELTSADEPTADELLADYDAIVVGSDWGFGGQSADALGDLLADYVDGGGVVVDTMFNHTSWTGMDTQETIYRYSHSPSFMLVLTPTYYKAPRTCQPNVVLESDALTIPVIRPAWTRRGQFTGKATFPRSCWCYHQRCLGVPT